MKSFLIHIDSLNVLDELGSTDEERYINAGKLLFAIREYQKGNNPEMDVITRVAFSAFKNQFDREREKYQALVDRNRKNGANGGRPRKNPKKPKQTQKTQSVIPGFDEFKEYALEKSPNVDLNQLKWKYDSWIENGWKDGHNKKIVKWKTKLLNTLKYIQDGKGNKGYNRNRAITKTQALFGQDQ